MAHGSFPATDQALDFFDRVGRPLAFARVRVDLRMPPTLLHLERGEEDPKLLLRDVPGLVQPPRHRQLMRGDRVVPAGDGFLPDPPALLGGWPAWGFFE